MRQHTWYSGQIDRRAADQLYVPSELTILREDDCRFAEHAMDILALVKELNRSSHMATWWQSRETDSIMKSTYAATR